MIRDGRATVHSIISRKVTITGFDLTNHRQCLQKWNQAIQTMNDQCEQMGPERCLKVKYEHLVLHPREMMEVISKFLDLPWDESVLHHEQFINKENGVALSKVERSSDQVIKPVNLEALTKWVGQFPQDVLNDMESIAPMLKVLGYNASNNENPNYGKADSAVRENTYKVSGV
jgi:protein-tyrosine sulfotransferase